ncbi:hypothetical protein [Qipengyuania mesophila]|uniref:hypothetical protein n=1 Tax=Qipengyuania mesophila TaxID=2867246 RepID=UPI00351485A5
MVRGSSSRSLERVRREIADQKQRRSADFLGSDKWDAERRIHSLQTSVAKYPDENELSRHAIVSGVAALQTYHRGFLSGVMQADTEFRLRGAEMLGEKYSLGDTLKHIGDEQLSAAELIAHAAPANSVSDLMNWLDHVFGTSFRELLSQAVDPTVRKNPEEASPILENVDDLLSELSGIFEKRHILAHEAAVGYEISTKAALTALDAVQKWIDATEGVLWQTVLINEPYTQFEINFSAGDKYRAARKRLAEVLMRCRGLVDRKQRVLLFRNHVAWKNSTLEFGELSFGRLDGTMWPAVRASVLTDLFEARSSALETWSYYLDL